LLGFAYLSGIGEGGAEGFQVVFVLGDYICIVEEKG